MESLLSKINIDDLEEKEFSIEELVDEYSQKLMELSILQKESPSALSEGKFESKTWIFYNDNTAQYSYIYFSKIEDLVKLQQIDNIDYQILKCWLVDSLYEEGYMGSTICELARSLIKIFTEARGFKAELVENEKGNLLTTFLDYSEQAEQKEAKLRALTSFAVFVEKIGYIKDGYDVLFRSVFNYKYEAKKDSVRSLPTNYNIFVFDACIKDFFKENTENDLLKRIYYPILIWWKITNVIPMRPSELTVKTTRDCLLLQDGKYYLKLNRVKITRTRYTKNKAMIPILNKVEISKEIYELIKEYIDFTDFTGSTSLFSWKALYEFKKEYMHTLSNDQYVNDVFFSPRSDRYNPLLFGNASLTQLLNNFYDNIIGSRYGIKIEGKERLTLGDTRHLAFTNLLLQGMSPVQIAMLGGHTTLEMQDSYVNHVSYYVDNELLNFISDRNIIGANVRIFNTLIKIVSEKPWSYQLEKDLCDFEMTEDRVGYCLLDIENDKSGCDDVPCCVFCKKWWCEPTTENYKAIKDYIINKKILPLQEELKVEEEFFKNLINEAAIVNVNGLLEIDRDDENAMKSQSIKIRAKAKKLVFLKASTIEIRFKDEIRALQNAKEEGVLIE